MDKNKIRDIIEEIKDIIVAKFNPEKIILFGSCAKEEVKPHDIDLFIVKKTHLDLHSRIIEIRKALPDNYPIDVIIYTPQEYEEHKDNKWCFLYRVVKEGKVIYERK